VLLAASLPVGAVRLADAAGADAEGRVSDGSWRALCERVKQAAAVVAPQVRRLGPEEAFGVAGTIRSLASLAGGEHPGFSMTRAEALRLATRLRRMTVRERRDDAGLYPDRADVIVPGVAVLVALMEIFDLSAVRYAAAGVREGLVHEYLGRLAS
jgi:exopolyphosphatase/guanosine-5'-triphosphate,3'-diphosphate pyrophosphatase